MTPAFRVGLGRGRASGGRPRKANPVVGQASVVVENEMKDPEIVSNATNEMK